MMTSIEAVIDRVINSPIKEYTKEEAIASLKELGILNSKNNVAKEYKSVISVSKKK